MYQWNPEDYNKNSEEQYKWAKELLSKLDLKGSERVLDIGCGDGKITAEIAKQLPQGSVLGIDNSDEMIHFARNNFPPNIFPNLTFDIMDARNSKFINEFNVVFSNAALHWVTDHLPLLEGIKRSLKSPGKILLQMGGKGNVVSFLTILQAALESKKWRKYFTGFSFPYGFFSDYEYRKMLNNAGIKAKRVELIPKVMAQQGKEGLTAWVRTTCLPYTQRVPEELRNEFINDTVEKYICNYPLDDGFVHIDAVRLEIEAET
ncbi:MAG: Trans-aconitate 2-methyltransferase [Pelotomaculum sp. PtaB.Bin104]|nr:MAG: Trans-aconitate 2-methyltransferase [Pelotomaculum sp. PtaB.Bin104]